MGECREEERRGQRVGGFVSRGVHVMVVVQSQIEQIILEHSKRIKEKKQQIN